MYYSSVIYFFSKVIVKTQVLIFAVVILFVLYINKEELLRKRRNTKYYFFQIKTNDSFDCCSLGAPALGLRIGGEVKRQHLGHETIGIGALRVVRAHPDKVLRVRVELILERDDDDVHAGGAGAAGAVGRGARADVVGHLA